MTVGSIAAEVGALELTHVSLPLSTSVHDEHMLTVYIADPAVPRRTG